MGERVVDKLKQQSYMRQYYLENKEATLEKQKAMMAEIATYLGELLYDDVVEKLRKIEVSTASVFKIGAWQNLIDPEMSDRLVEYCQPLCQESGYNI